MSKKNSMSKYMGDFIISMAGMVAGILIYDYVIKGLLVSGTSKFAR